MRNGAEREKGRAGGGTEGGKQVFLNDHRFPKGYAAGKMDITRCCNRVTHSCSFSTTNPSHAPLVERSHPSGVSQPESLMPVTTDIRKVLKSKTNHTE